MDRYEYPLGVTFRASTPEHAAARAFGGKPSDYVATRTAATTTAVGTFPAYVTVTDAAGNYVGDIPIV